MCPTIAAVRRICHVSDAETALLEGSARPIVLLQRTGSGASESDAERGRLRGSRVRGARRDAAVHADASPAHARSVGAARHDQRQRERRADRQGQRRGRASARRASPTGSSSTIGTSMRDTTIPWFEWSTAPFGWSGVLADTVHSRSASTHARTACWRSAPISRTRSVSSMTATRSPVRTSVTSTVCVRSSHHDEALRTYLRLFRTSRNRRRRPASRLRIDAHLAERWWESGAREIRVQHHHAHVASVLAEHGLRGTVLGVALDGVGLGPDHSIWGGEFLLCDERSYRRVAHIAPVRQPGGDACAREGWRMAIAYLSAAGVLGDAPPAGSMRSTGSPDPASVAAGLPRCRLGPRRRSARVRAACSTPWQA